MDDGGERRGRVDLRVIRIEPVHKKVNPPFAEAVFDLEVAAGICGGDDLGAGGGEVAYLAVLEPGGGVGVRDGVDAGTAAAPLGLGAFAEFDAGKRAEDFTGLGADLLAVAKVAGFVIGHGAKNLRLKT